MAKKDETLQNKEAEQAAIGSVFTNPDCFNVLRSIISPGDFCTIKHGWIWQVFCDLVDRGMPIDQVTVSSELAQMGKLEDLGGEFYLQGLITLVPSSLHAESYARLVKDQAFRRKIRGTATDLATMAYDQKIPTDLLTERVAKIAQEATGTTEQQYNVRDMAYCFEPRAPRKYLLEDLIQEKSITVLYGDGGTKKTWSSVFLGVCIASGLTWGNFSTEKTKVLFIDEENGESDMTLRSAMCCRGALASPDAVDFKLISLASFHLDNAGSAAILANEILAEEAKFVILDPLASIMTGDENTKQDTQPVFNTLRKMTETTGAAFMVVHHANRQGGFRGSSVVKDAPDVLIQAESDPDSPFINFKTEKNRKGKPAKWTMRATWTEDSFYLSAAEPKEKPMGKGEEFVLSFLQENGDSERDAIIGSAKNCSPGTARNAISSLTDKGKIIRKNPDKNLKIKAIYGLVPDD